MKKPRIIPVVMRGFCSHIISYQEITGNYSSSSNARHAYIIISYQEITGNYSPAVNILDSQPIISYKKPLESIALQYQSHSD